MLGGEPVLQYECRMEPHESSQSRFSIADDTIQMYASALLVEHTWTSYVANSVHPGF